MTIKETKLFEKLSLHNKVSWHMQPGGDKDEANRAQVYLSSVNGLSETGELINIDGVGNRVSATAYGPKRVYFVVGKNKVAPDFEQALWRARNIAGPKNAARFDSKTPCVTGEPRCYDCSSPDRICCELLVLWHKPMRLEEMEVILIDENLGY